MITVRYPVFRRRCHHLGPGFYGASAAHTQREVNSAKRSLRLRSANAAERPRGSAPELADMSMADGTLTRYLVERVFGRWTRSQSPTDRSICYRVCN